MSIVQKLRSKQNLEDCEFLQLLSTNIYDEQLAKAAEEVRIQHYGRAVFLRGLIEFTNFCKNNCYYCGIRRDNTKAERYRLSLPQVLDCCAKGYALGYRTFVLQGGEDPYFTKERISELIAAIHKTYQDCAITLSIGEYDENTYAKWFEAGASRYLLRHETSSQKHYSLLHPAELSLKRRKQCLQILKKIGYQVGAGFMVGSPYQTLENIIEDLRFLKGLSPDMVGIGPFIRHIDTPFANFGNGSVELTLRLLGITRLMLPHVLLPATTALSTLDPLGREKALKFGANVIMPNLSPVSVRKKYALYDDKACSGEEAAEYKNSLEQRVISLGYKIVSCRGDVVR